MLSGSTSTAIKKTQRFSICRSTEGILSSLFSCCRVFHAPISSTLNVLLFAKTPEVKSYCSPRMLRKILKEPKNSTHMSGSANDTSSNSRPVKKQSQSNRKSKESADPQFQQIQQTPPNNSCPPSSLL